MCVCVGGGGEHPTHPGAAQCCMHVIGCACRYKGRTWTLHPRKGKPGRKIGRSTGKAFVADGISLPDDSEVSTTHGKVRGGEASALCAVSAPAAHTTHHRHRLHKWTHAGHTPLLGCALQARPQFVGGADGCRMHIDPHPLQPGNVPGRSMLHHSSSAAPPPAPCPPSPLPCFWCGVVPL